MYLCRRELGFLIGMLIISCKLVTLTDRRFDHFYLNSAEEHLTKGELPITA